MIFLNSLPYLENSIYLTNRLERVDIPSLSIPLKYYHVLIRALYLDGLIGINHAERLLALKRDLDVLCNDTLSLRVLEAISPEVVCDIIYLLRGYFFGRGGEILPIIPSIPNTSLVSLLSLSPEEEKIDLIIDCRFLPGKYGMPFNTELLHTILSILRSRFKVHLVVDDISIINDEIVISPITDKWNVTAFRDKLREMVHVSGGSQLRIVNTRLEIMNLNIEWLRDKVSKIMYRPPEELNYLELAFPQYHSQALDILDELWASTFAIERLLIEKIRDDIGDVALEVYYKLLRYDFIRRIPSSSGYVVVPSNKGLRALLHVKGKSSEEK